MQFRFKMEDLTSTNQCAKQHLHANEKERGRYSVTVLTVMQRGELREENKRLAKHVNALNVSLKFSKNYGLYMKTD